MPSSETPRCLLAAKRGREVRRCLRETGVKRWSVRCYKRSKVANCFQKFLPAFFATYLSGCQGGDFIDRFLESGKLTVPKVRFDWRSLSDQFKPFAVELIR